MKYSEYQHPAPKVLWLEADKWMLFDEFLIHYREGEAWKHLTVPCGFECDGPSIPWFGRWLLDRNGAIFPLALGHDRIYYEGKWSRHDADRWLRDGARSAGLPEWRVFVYYWMCRAFGGSAWRRHEQRRARGGPNV